MKLKSVPIVLFGAMLSIFGGIQLVHLQLAKDFHLTVNFGPRNTPANPESPEKPAEAASKLRKQREDAASKQYHEVKTLTGLRGPCVEKKIHQGVWRCYLAPDRGWSPVFYCRSFVENDGKQWCNEL